MYILYSTLLYVSPIQGLGGQYLDVGVILARLEIHLILVDLDIKIIEVVQKLWPK